MIGIALACSEESEIITMESPIFSVACFAVRPFGRLVGVFGAKSLLHEADDFLRAVDDEIRGDGVEPVRYRFCSCRHHVLPGVERSGLTPELRPGLRAFAKLQKVPARRRKIVILRDS